MSDNEIYLLIKYIKSVLWRVAKRLSYIEDARCLKVYRVPEEEVVLMCCRSQRGWKHYQTGFVLPHEHLLCDTPKVPIMFQ